MTLLDVVPAAGEDRAQVLRLAGALEDASEHPVARAVATGATEQVGTLPPVEGFTTVEGLGVQGVVDGHAVLVGRTRLLAEWSHALSPELERARAAAEAEGRTAVGRGGAPGGAAPGRVRGAGAGQGRRRGRGQGRRRGRLGRRRARGARRRRRG